MVNDMEQENQVNKELREQEAPAERGPAPALGALSRKQAPRLQTAQAQPPAESPEVSERVMVCDVQFRPGSKIYFFDPAGLELKNGDHVIIDTSRGAEYGFCVLGSHKINRRELVQPLRRVLRVATPIDERIKAENERREKEAYAFCLKKIEELGLDMQLVSVECAFDGSKLLFFFTADGRVDFRELVRILASNFHIRIELRQIGVRDKAKMLGGLGICGRPFCCASFLEDFQPVSIKMAKTQSLSLNPTKISGTCGRLMCCLKYEQDAYEDLIKTSPKPESLVDTPDGRGTVASVNLMRQSVSVRMEKGDGEVHTYRNADICVLRSGKPRKNDPPIPEDLAPISGRREEGLPLYSRLEQRLTVDPEQTEELYEAPAAVSETPESQAEPPHREQSAENGASRRQRRERRPQKPFHQLKPEQAKAEQVQAEQSKPEQPKPERPAPAEKKQEKKQDNSRRKKNKRPPEKAPEQAERVERPVKQEQAKQPSRQQRRRKQQGKPAAKLPEPEQAKRPAPEKRPEEQPAPKPEGKKNNKRRYYYNRKPKG